MESRGSSPSISEHGTWSLARRPRRPLEAVVRVLGATAHPAEFRLGAGSCILGAGRQADVIIEHRAVSRSHAKLTLVPEGVHVEDLASSNGTFFGGQRIDGATLALGCRFALGNVEVALEAQPPSNVRGSDREEYLGLVGRSAAMREVFGVLERLEGSLVNVLLSGESGVGKEVAARALHLASDVGRGPLHSVNCGSVPPTLMASELFGHRRGAFTGAMNNRSGAFDAADGGTLFLDEIGELPLSCQPMLLRALETSEVAAVGEVTPRRVRVRVIAATNRDLHHEVASGRFREDLLYRLSVIELRLPPLRERLDDIDLLVPHLAEQLGMPTPATEIIDQLRSRSWPGNVRELKNALRAYAVIGELPNPPRSNDDPIAVAVRAMLAQSTHYGTLKQALNDRFTRVYVRLLMERAGNNQSEAARLGGMDRGYLRKLLAKL